LNTTIEFLFDYASPFSYLANSHIEGVARRYDAQIVYVPILLGAIMKATGNISPANIPAKARYMAIELRRWTDRYGVPFQRNPHAFVGNSLRLMRGAVAAQKLGVFLPYHRAVYSATWADAEDLGDDKVLHGVLKNAGIVDDLIAVTERQDVKDHLRGNTDEALRRGVFGAPTFFVGGEMFWGNDRFDFLEEALRKRAQE
jgi:2-hydroxychromene-2-carboxylate isomerase